jgi:microcystin-dependent protein
VSEAYIGEIRIFAGSRCPTNWHFCDGTVLPIQDNEALFSLIGITYGGDGQTNFALPDLRGKVPVHMGQGTGLTARTIGLTGGTTDVGLVESNLPNHTHSLMASQAPAMQNAPANLVLATSSNVAQYIEEAAAGSPVTFDPLSIQSVGGSATHANRMPSLALNFIICLSGMYPVKSN